MKEKLITVRETSQILGISEKEVIDLAKKGKIPSYFVGKEFLRFPKEEVERYKPDIQEEFNILSQSPTLEEQVKEFLYFNDFYLISGLIVGVLLAIIIFS